MKSWTSALLLLACLLPAGCGGTSRGWVRADGTIRWPRAVRYDPPERGYDVEHYRIELSLRPELRAIDGRTRVRLFATDDLRRVVLDLVGLQVDDVRDDAGRALAFTHDSGRLEVELAEPAGSGELVQLEVRYHGRPATGLWFSGESYDGAPTQCFTQGQPEHSRGWFPCFDHPSDRVTSEVVVTMPAEWIGVAPGECLDVSVSDGRRREHWRMTTPHPCYLISLVAGELFREEGFFGGVPLSYYAEEKYRDWVMPAFEETGAILSFLEAYTGVDYPYGKYSQAVVTNFPGGGMENVTATTLTPLVFGDDLSRRDYTATTLLAHEAAHQWFGNLLTCADWTHLWLNEGFATYLSLLYFEETRGGEEFLCRLRDATQRYLSEDRDGDRRPAVCDSWKEPEDLFDTRTYEGAAARLHLLRSILGDETFRTCLRDYLTSHTGRSVKTEDLRRSFEASSGQNLEVFFDQWILGPGFPELAFEWFWDEGARVVRGTVRQTQDFSGGTARVFRVPIEIQVGEELHRIELMERDQSFVLPAERRPEFCLLDPDARVPKTVTWPKRSHEEWIAISRHATSVDARRNAAVALGPLAARTPRTSPVREELTRVLSAVLREDPNTWVRRDAARSLAWVLEGEVWEALAGAAAEDPDAGVRTAALRSLAYCGPHEGLAEFGRRMFDESYSWETMGAAAALVASADPAGAPAWLSKGLRLDSPHDHLAGLLLACLARFPGREIEEELASWALDPTLAPTARAVAARGLAVDPDDRGEVRRVLERLMEEESFRLRLAAIETLGALDDLPSRRILTGYYPLARTSKERRAIEASVRTVP